MHRNVDRCVGLADLWKYLASILQDFALCLKLTRPGIGRNVSCALGDCLTSRHEDRSLGSCGSRFIPVYVHVHVGNEREVGLLSMLALVHVHVQYVTCVKFVCVCGGGGGGGV